MVKGLHITPLAGTNAKDFEDRMITWALEVREFFTESVKIFNKDALRVGQTTKVDGHENIYQVKLPRISIEYMCITRNMCVLTKVIQTDGEKENKLYEIHDSWEGTYLWVAY